MKRYIPVVGAVIVRNDAIFCTRRGPAMSLPGMWEFPGGKIEAGERAAGALVREIQEELQCTVRVGERVEQTVYEYDFGTVDLTTYFCEIISGAPRPTEHSEAVWIPASELRNLQWAPADIPAVNAIVENYRRGAHVS